MKRPKTPLLLVLASLPGAWTALGGCVPVTTRAEKEAPAIALARGARSSGLAIHPPYLSGPLFTLILQHHFLSGWIAGESAPAGAIGVHIEDESASGYGPHGPVAMDFQWTEEAATVEGQWNGSRVHLVITGEALRGTVADNSDLLVTPRRDGSHRQSSCEYVLDTRGADGAFTGTSICSGMPQPTRLEIPPAAATWLSRPELLTVLTAFLSAPPLPVSEGQSPIAEPPLELGGWR
jgi:hypothetical protein